MIDYVAKLEEKTKDMSMRGIEGHRGFEPASRYNSVEQVSDQEAARQHLNVLEAMECGGEDPANLVL